MPSIRIERLGSSPSQNAAGAAVARTMMTMVDSNAGNTKMPNGAISFKRAMGSSLSHWDNLTTLESLDANCKLQPMLVPGFQLLLSST